jgi:hypothetical protein
MALHLRLAFAPQLAIPLPRAGGEVDRAKPETVRGCFCFHPTPKRNPWLASVRWNRTFLAATIGCNAAGCLRMAKHCADIERQMAIARAQMDKHKVALSVLAREENSAYWSEEFRAKLGDGEKRLDNHRTINPT